MSKAVIVHRFITDLNPITAEWILVRGTETQSDPDTSLRSNLANPLCGTAMPTNKKLEAPSKLSLEMKRGDSSLTLHGLADGEDALLLVIGFGTVDLRDLFVAEEEVREVL